MGNDQFHHRGKAEQEGRRVNTREPRKKILIVCEGTKTEPHYFEGFRLTNVTIDGCGKDPSHLAKIAEDKYDDFEEIWCVFDKDSFEGEKFNAPLQLSKEKPNIKPAYTNEAFELWFLLHFDYQCNGISRKQYEEKLSKPKRLGHKYEKNSRTMYTELKSRQQTAIDYARKLLESYNNHNPEKDNPSTTVHELVEELNRWKK